jgi:hypothetical protein
MDDMDGEDDMIDEEQVRVLLSSNHSHPPTFI